jgi:hypothetical protein
VSNERRDDQEQAQPAESSARRAWKRPVLTSYGPIGKLTQGGTGAKTDGASSRKATCL